MVGAVDRILDVERPAKGRATALSQSSTVIVPSGRSAMICSVAPFSADTLDAHQPVAEAGDHRLDDMGDAGLEARLGR